MSGLRFRETMTGRIALRSSDPVDGYRERHAVAISLRAEVDIADVAEFIAAGHHVARFRAEVVIPVLGGRFLSRDGTFLCFERGDGPNGRQVQQMLYTATFFNDDRMFQMSARKILEPGWPWRVWRDTTTLHVTIVDVTADPDTERPRQIAGILRLRPSDFGRQLTTMDSYGVPRGRSRLGPFALYAVFFVKGLAKTYLLRARW